ncbi:hypothetical protein FACS1894180_3560 [Bacteroidia bacterium]|nr:hypothetical protein FACS1894180_3560 [Bacteroidia bacterium]
MRLHENTELFQNAIVATAQQKGIPEIYVEKDYWVTLALKQIFTNEIGKETVFKGGTALSKCFGLIERFSEDIDLVVLRKGDESSNQLKTKIKKMTACIERILPEIEIEGITHKRGTIRKTAHSYNRLFSGHFGQVRDMIVVESTWLGNFEPYTTAQISSFIYEIMLTVNQQTLIDEFEMNPFEVQVLNPKRTLCEKIMSLYRFSQTTEPIKDLSNKIRHTYDLHFMLKNSDINTFFYSKDFEIMLLKVANEDVESFKNSNEWLQNHPTKAMIYANPEETWNQIKSVYTSTFSELVFGKLPQETEILQTLKIIAERLKPIEWKVVVR